MSWLLVAVGAALGAPLRYVTDRTVQRVVGSHKPYGTFVVNITGSFLLGVLVGSGAGSHSLALLGTGLFGAFTTYSTFAYEVFALGRSHRTGWALLYALGSVALGLPAAVAGLASGAHLG
ncbi:MAG: fluoride efflux transporter FluC [Nocardioidaceae bacterium]